MNEVREKAPDGGWGWMCVLGSSLSHIMSSILIRSYGIFYLKFLEHYGQSASATSWVGAANMLAWGLCGPIASALCRKTSCRVTTCIGAFIIGTSIIATGFAPNFVLLFIFYTISGIGMCLSYTPGYIIVGQYFDERRATAMSLSSVGAGIGSFVYPPILHILFEEYGYQGGMMITGAVLFNAFVSAALYRPLKATSKPEQLPLKENEHDQHAICDNEEMKQEDVSKELNHVDTTVDNSTAITPMLDNAQTDTKAEKEKPKRDWCHTCNSTVLSHLYLLKNPVFLAIFLVNFGGVYGMQISAAFMPALAIDNGTEKFKAGFLLSVIGITDTISRLTSGFFLDINFIKPYRVYIFTFCVTLVGVVAICVPLYKVYAWYVFFMCLRGFFGGLFLAQRATILTDIIGAEQAGDAFGFILMANAFGSLFGRVSGGIVKDRLGNYGYAFYIAGSFTVMTTGVLFCTLVWYYRGKKKDAKQSREDQAQNA